MGKPVNSVFVVLLEHKPEVLRPPTEALPPVLGILAQTGCLIKVQDGAVQHAALVASPRSNYKYLGNATGNTEE